MMKLAHRMLWNIDGGARAGTALQGIRTQSLDDIPMGSISEHCGLHRVLIRRLRLDDWLALDDRLVIGNGRSPALLLA
jgi:hypothetical protein